MGSGLVPLSQDNLLTLIHLHDRTPVTPDFKTTIFYPSLRACGELK